MNTLLNAARDAWLSAAQFRQSRMRFKRYTYGDQWCDTMTGPFGRQYSEHELIHLSGKQPYCNNLIRQIVKTIVGRFRSIAAERGYYDRRRGSVDTANSTAELDARLLEEFLISGMAVQKVERGATGPVVRNVDPRRFFINRIRDPRGRDIELVGECLDMSLPELLQRFGRGDIRRMSRLTAMFNGSKAAGIDTPLGLDHDADEFSRADSGKCRVIELWTLDSVSRVLCSDPVDGDVYYRDLDQAERVLDTNLDRRRHGIAEIELVPDIEFVWNCRWLTPWGELLDSRVSDYRRGHPYILRLYPLTDGEIHPFVEDIIDQQRLINRLIVMIDKMMTTSAKGVLLFPMSQLPDGLDMDDVSATWARSDGIIPIVGKPNMPLPQQVITNTDGAGAYRMLELQMQLFDNIAGVGTALRGEAPRGTAGAGLYERQVENATIAMSDLLETFTAIIMERKEVIRDL